MVILKHLKLSNMFDLIQIIPRELQYSLLKSLILKFVKNVKCQCGDAAAYHMVCVRALCLVRYAGIQKCISWYIHFSDIFLLFIIVLQNVAIIKYTLYIIYKYIHYLLTYEILCFQISAINIKYCICKFLFPIMQYVNNKNIDNYTGT